MAAFEMYQAAALNAFLQRGHSIESAVELAREAATKLVENDSRYEVYESEAYA